MTIPVSKLYFPAPRLLSPGCPDRRQPPLLSISARKEASGTENGYVSAGPSDPLVTAPPASLTTKPPLRFLCERGCNANPLSAGTFSNQSHLSTYRPTPLTSFTLFFCPFLRRIHRSPDIAHSHPWRRGPARAHTHTYSQLFFLTFISTVGLYRCRSHH